MKIEDIHKTLSTKWNYLGHNKYSDPDMCSQKDWNETIITMINQVSTQIHMSTCVYEEKTKSTIELGPADTVIMNWRCFDLINNLEYFKIKKGMIGNRYKVIIDDDIKEDCVYVCRKDVPINYEKKDRTIGVVKIENY